MASALHLHCSGGKMSCMWLLCLSVVLAADDPLILRTQNGLLRGFHPPDNTDSRAPVTTRRAWRGVPYAAPPVRFHPAQPPQEWTGVRNATTFAADCAQLGPAWETLQGVKNSSEDCLYLVSALVSFLHLGTSIYFRRSIQFARISMPRCQRMAGLPCP